MAARLATSTSWSASVRTPLFGRQGKTNLTIKVPVTFPEAALGTQVKVPTLGSPVTVKVPAGTQKRKEGSGSAGRGIQPAKGEAGDLLVTFDVVVPSELTEDQRKAVAALGEQLGGGTRENNSAV